MKRSKTNAEALGKGKEMDEVLQSDSPVRKKKCNFSTRAWPIVVVFLHNKNLKSCTHLWFHGFPASSSYAWKIMQPICNGGRFSRDLSTGCSKRWVLCIFIVLGVLHIMMLSMTLNMMMKNVLQLSPRWIKLQLYHGCESHPLIRMIMMSFCHDIVIHPYKEAKTTFLFNSLCHWKWKW